MTTRGHVYVSNENSTLVEVYFDDVVVTQTKTNLIQGNEYYPFGMQTANSWTREAVTGNNYLANGGTELNTTTQLYDLDFRNYDPALGRMYGVDPVAAKYASLTPYNYSFNNPTAFSDVSGADPNETVNYSAMNSQYYLAYTYDDKIESRQTAVWYDAMGWRNEVPGANAFYNRATGGYPGASGGGGWVLTIGSLRIDYNSLEDGSHFFGIENGEMTYYNYRSTRELLYEAGAIIARDAYGGDGRIAPQIPYPYPPSTDLQIRFIKSVQSRLFSVLRSYSGKVMDSRSISGIRNDIEDYGKGTLFIDENNISYPKLEDGITHPWDQKFEISLLSYNLSFTAVDSNDPSLVFRSSDLIPRFDDNEFLEIDRNTGQEGFVSYGQPSFGMNLSVAGGTLSIQVIYQVIIRN